MPSVKDHVECPHPQGPQCDLLSSECDWKKAESDWPGALESGTLLSQTIKILYRFNLVFWSSANPLPSDKLSLNTATQAISHIQTQRACEVHQAGYKLNHKSKRSTFKNNNKANKANNDDLSDEIKGHCDHQIAMPSILFVVPELSCRRGQPWFLLQDCQWLRLRICLYLEEQVGGLVLNQVSALWLPSRCILSGWND